MSEDVRKLDAVELVAVLRGFARAYPEDVFPPLTGSERERLGPLADRCAAQMARHLVPYLDRAADVIESFGHDATADRCANNPGQRSH